MSKSLARFKHYLLAACFFLLVGLTGCSSDSTTATSSSSSANALPQPSVDCGGSSCID